MKKYLAVALVLGCWASLPLAGQQLPPMGPPEELKEAAFLLGEWTAEFQMRMEPNAEWTTSQATMSTELILNGCAQRSYFKSDMMGMPFEGIATLSYDRTSRKWQNVWIDSMGAYQNVTEGSFKEGKMVFTGSDESMGIKLLTRDVTTKVSDSEIQWYMEVSSDEGQTWWKNLQATYKKKM